MDEPRPEKDRFSFLRIFAASWIGLLVGYLAAAGAALLGLYLLVSLIDTDDPETVFGALVGATLGLLLLGLVVWAAVSVLLGRFLVRVFTGETLRYWKAAVALLLPAFAVFILGVPITVVIPDETATTVISFLLQFGAAPAASAGIILALREA